MRASGETSTELGLHFNASFLADRRFHAAAAVAPLLLSIALLAFPGWRHGIPLSAPVLLSLIFWQPLMEELFFRGFLQEQLNGCLKDRSICAGLTVANLVTSLLFGAFHLLHQPFPFAAAVAIPSLVFGYFRERHRHLYSAILLHGFYNAAYLAAGAGW